MYSLDVQYDTAIIPCMSTQPNVSVELKFEETTVPDNQYIQFNPKVGLFICQFGIFLFCYFNHGSQHFLLLQTVLYVCLNSLFVCFKQFKCLLREACLYSLVHALQLIKQDTFEHLNMFQHVLYLKSLVHMIHIYFKFNAVASVYLQPNV